MENTITPENQSVNETPKRSQFLTVLCVLSFIWSGIILFSLFLALFLRNFIFTTVEKILNGEMEGMPPLSEEQQKGIQVLLDFGPQKYLMIVAVAIIVYMTSLLGVVKMWKLHKWGFYIYAGVNGFALAYDIVSGAYFSVIITIAFIGMYFSNFKQLKY
jgi:hypothetical protein